MACSGFGQTESMSFGFQIKPLVPSDFLGAEDQVIAENNFQVDFQPLLGLSVGAVVRKNFTPTLALETGIGLVRRNFKADMMALDTANATTLRFRMLSYEIPVQGLLYVQLGEDVYMNAAAGVAFNMYPSNYQASFADFSALTLRRRWLQMALTVNVGVEYRTDKKGYFYLGASYNQSFDDIVRTVFKYRSLNGQQEISAFSTGNYLTLDLRYFFADE